MGEPPIRMRSFSRYLLLTLLLAAPLPAAAQSYPNKPVHIIVPYLAGGVVDALIRSVGQHVSDTLGQPVIVDNKPGANTIIALDLCAKSAPDGYTLCSSSADGMSFNPYLYKNLPYDADRDFAPITQLVWVPGLIVGNPKVPYDSVKGMVEYAKKNPGKVNFASFGQGSTPHFYVEWYRNRLGADLVHVPYKGMAQIIPALLAGEVDVTFTAMGIVLPQIAAGQLTPLAVTNPQRSQALPNVSTLTEQGLDPHLQNWFGVFAPARTPPDVIGKLNAAFVKALRDPKFHESFLKVQAYDAVGNSPQEFAAFLKQDRANAKDVVATTGIHLDDQVPTR